MEKQRGPLDRNSVIFRLLFLLAAVPLVLLCLYNTYHLVNVGTDQTYFDTSKSRLYIFRSLNQTTFLRTRGLLNFQGGTEPNIRSGDLVVAINGQEVNSYADVDTALNLRQSSPQITMEIQRPDRREFFMVFRVARAELEEQFLWEIPPTVHVFASAKGGAAQRAGMLEGDLIHTINGQTFFDEREAEDLIRSTLKGQTVDYGIIRAGEFLTLQVTMARLSIAFSTLFSIVCGFLWFSVATTLGLLRPGFKAARLLSLAFLLIGTSLLLYETRGGPLAEPLLGYLRMLGWPAFFFGVATLLHAAYYFPKEEPDLLAQSLGRYLVYPIAGLASVWAFLAGSSSVVFGLIMLVIPQVLIRLRHRRRMRGEQVRLEKYLILAGAFALIAILGWTFLQARLSPAWDLTLRDLISIVVLFAYLATIARFRLLGFNFRRGFVFVIASLFWKVFVAVLFFLMLDLLAASEINLLNIQFTSHDIEFLDKVSPQARAYNQRLTAIFLALILGFAFYRLSRHGRRLLRRKFHRSDYDYLKVATELTELFSARLTLEELGRGLAEALSRRMLLKRVGVLFFDEGGEPCCAETAGIDDPTWRRLCMDKGGLLAAGLKRYESALRVDYLDPEIKGELRTDGFRYVFPIRANEELVGCLMIGEKLAETVYGAEDFRFLSAAVKQAAVAIENALLYGKLGHQERLKHELDLARHIQISSLPQSEPEVTGLDVAGASIPALEVGGDYYAYFEQDHKELTVVVADVSGKGTSAALYMSKMQGIFCSLHDTCQGPGDLFLKANPILYRETERTAFVTAICTHFDTDHHKLVLARAGHIPLLWYRPNTRTATSSMPKGLGLGIEDKGLFNKLLEETVIKYQPNDVFLLVTDGITEGHDQEYKVFGEARLLELLKLHAHKSALKIRQAILDELADYCFGTEQRDDQTLVVVKILETRGARKTLP